MSNNWVVNLEEMTCLNSGNNIIVTFEKKGEALIGKIKDIPNELLELWAEEKNGHLNIKNAVMKAENVFTRAYFESDIAKKM